MLRHCLSFYRPAVGLSCPKGDRQGIRRGEACSTPPRGYATLPSSQLAVVYLISGIPYLETEAGKTPDPPDAPERVLVYPMDNLAETLVEQRRL
jgi:hypothetical protein